MNPLKKMPAIGIPAFEIRYSMALAAFCCCLILVSSSFAIQNSTQPNPTSTGFEGLPTGTFDSITTSVGVWKSTQGSVLINQKQARTGQRCLQLAGGDSSSVELHISDAIKTVGKMQFWAERWTSKAPFSFQVLQQTGDNDPDEWKLLYDGSKSIVVGRSYLSHVKFAFDPNKGKRLKFRVTSPENTGVLIDDFRFAPDVKQSLISGDVIPVTLPVLLGSKASPLVKLKFKTIGSLEPQHLTAIRCTIPDDCDPTSLVSVTAYTTGEESEFKAARAISDPVLVAGRSFELKPNFPLDDGDNFIWLTAEVSASADLDQFAAIEVSDIEVGDKPNHGESFAVSKSVSKQRFGVAVRRAGDDGIHTYRIPGLVTTKAGTLIAVYDNRHDSSGDLPGNIDVGMSRSTDGGKTWESMKTIMDMGNDPKWRHDGIGDPSILVDKTTGTIWVASTWSHGNRSWTGSGPGLEPEETGQFMLTKSDDDGVTWSEPINITKQVKDPSWCFILQGPGKGIKMSDGTLVFPAQFQDPPHESDRRKHRLPHSTIIYSRDHGKTWHVGAPAFDDTTEAQVVELEDGRLMLNCRYNRGNHRVIMTTDDMGKTWQEHSTSRGDLIEPRSCMASLINLSRDLGDPKSDWLLFSNPDSLKGRKHITIKASPNHGNTWPEKHNLLLDQGSGRGYSCMTTIDEETIGILYESSQADLVFQRVKIADIVSSQASTPRLQVARVFTDHMVLQANQPVRIWGTGAQGTTLEIKIQGHSTTATVDASGNWLATLPAMPRNDKPQKLTVQSQSESYVLDDVLVGEVWLCAGQSNMAWPVAKSDVSEKTGPSPDPQLRLMSFKSTVEFSSRQLDEVAAQAIVPATLCDGHWLEASESSTPQFSAVAYAFGQQLRKRFNGPIGIIDISHGGTPIESWISLETIRGDPKSNSTVEGNWLDNPSIGEWCRTRARQNLKLGIDAEFTLASDQLGPNHPFKPGFMYASSFEPFTPMTIAGVLWYQGESNAQARHEVEQYDRLFPKLVSSWRSELRSPELPFCFVQLPGMNRPHWPVFREYQRRSLDRLKNVGMVVTINDGNANNVHPRTKQVVGKRLADWALVTKYGHEGPSMGPLYHSMKVRNHRAMVQFTSIGNGLSTAYGKAPRHFELAGQNRSWKPASAKILSANTVEVFSKEVLHPKYVRYAWKPFLERTANLENSQGLPASPFTSEEDF